MGALQVAILVEAGFVPTELALVQDVLRIANRLEDAIRFNAQICTTQGDDLVEGLGASLVRAQPFAPDSAGLPNHIVVLGGSGVGAAFTTLKARLSWLERMGVSMTLLSDAAAEWKRRHDDPDRFTTHWEIQQLDRDAGRTVGGDLPLFAQQARVTTGAGMASTADLVLTHIVAPHSLHLAQSVAQVMLLGDIRDGRTDQPRSQNDVMSLRHVKLEPVISAMEEALEAPLAMSDLAAISGVSVRQMERKFKLLLGQSPGAFYRRLRLRRARDLVEQTALPITEVAIACGFGSMSNFSKKYAQEFGVSPSKWRTGLKHALHPLKRNTDQQGSYHAPLPLSPGSSCPPVHAAGTHETLVRGTGR